MLLKLATYSNILIKYTGLSALLFILLWLPVPWMQVKAHADGLGCTGNDAHTLLFPDPTLPLPTTTIRKVDGRMLTRFLPGGEQAEVVVRQESKPDQTWRVFRYKG